MFRTSREGAVSTQVPSDALCLDAVTAACVCLKTPKDRGMVADLCCLWCCGSCVACRSARHVYDYENAPDGGGCRATDDGDVAGGPQADVTLPPMSDAIRAEFETDFSRVL